MCSGRYFLDLRLREIKFCRKQLLIIHIWAKTPQLLGDKCLHPLSGEIEVELQLKNKMMLLAMGRNKELGNMTGEKRHQWPATQELLFIYMKSKWNEMPLAQLHCWAGLAVTSITKCRRLTHSGGASLRCEELRWHQPEPDTGDWMNAVSHTTCSNLLESARMGNLHQYRLKGTKSQGTLWIINTNKS